MAFSEVIAVTSAVSTRMALSGMGLSERSSHPVAVVTVNSDKTA